MARSRMHVEYRSVHESQSLAAQSVADSKKDLKQEVADIRGFTLMFENESMEMKWNLTHLERQIGITTRYLFAASFFQGLFYWSDCLESHGDSTYLFHLGCLRLILGGMTLLGCFLVSTGLVIPTQMAMFWINMCYGFPSLAIFYLARPSASVFDSLFLVYGLCFFILPKISPLNFIYGFSGALLYTFLFIYISAFRLSLQQWLLSNTFLMIIVSLFCYISYSAERVSRERWLLRERLKREKINLRIVASSIQDDLTRAANDERNFSLDVMNQSHSGKAIRLLATLGGNTTASSLDSDHRTKDEDNESENLTLNTSSQNSNESPGKKQKQNQKRMALFFRSLGGWALCYGMGYAFDYVSQPASFFPREINSSPAFALLMHSMGFSVFLMSYTGQMRWLALNGVVGLALLWIFNQSGMDSRWVVFSTHSVGYVLLAVVLIIMILVFGGVVLVWSHLIDFLKEILVRYPEVQEEISENKVLEQVLIRYISDMPKTKLLSRSGSDFNLSDSDREASPPHVLQVYKDCDSDEEGARKHRIGPAIPYTESSRGVYGVSSAKKHRSAPNVAQLAAHVSLPSRRATGFEARNVDTFTHAPSTAVTSVSCPATPITAGAGVCKIGKNKAKSLVKSNKKSASEDPCQSDDMHANMRVITAKRSDSCFFCLKNGPQLLVPACIGWLPRTEPTPSSSSTTSENAAAVDEVVTGIPMCTPYGDMVKMRDCAITASDQARISMTQSAMKVELYEAEKSAAVAACAKMQKKMSEMEQAMMLLMKSCEDQVNAEKKQRDAHVQSIIAQHNHQLSELKKLQKAVAAKKSASMKAVRSVTSPTVTPDKPEIPSDAISATPPVLSKLSPAVPACPSTRLPGTISKLHTATAPNFPSSSSHQIHPAHVRPLSSPREESSQSQSQLQSQSQSQLQSRSHQCENVAALHKSGVTHSEDDTRQCAVSREERPHRQRPNFELTKGIDPSDTQYGSHGCSSIANASLSDGTLGQGGNRSVLCDHDQVDNQDKSFYSTDAPLIYLRPHQIYDYQAVINDTDNVYGSDTYPGLGVLQSSDAFSSHSSVVGGERHDDSYRMPENDPRLGPRSHASHGSFSNLYNPNPDMHSRESYYADDNSNSSSSSGNTYLPAPQKYHPSYLPSDYSSLNSHGYIYQNHQQQSEELDINDAESRFWLPSLDFDEIQQLLRKELRYPDLPCPSAGPNTDPAPP